MKFVRTVTLARRIDPHTELKEIIEKHLSELQAHFHKNEFCIVLLEENLKHGECADEFTRIETEKKLKSMNEENEVIGKQIEKYAEKLIELMFA